MAVTHFWSGFSLFPLQTRRDESPAAWAWPGVKHPEHGPCHQLSSKNQCFSWGYWRTSSGNQLYIYIYMIKSGCCCFSKRKFQLFILKLDQKGRACPAWPHFAFQMRMVLFQLTSKGHPWPQCHSSYSSDPGCKGTNFIRLHGWRALIGGMMKPDGIKGKLRVCRKQRT